MIFARSSTDYCHQEKRRQRPILFLFGCLTAIANSSSLDAAVIDFSSYTVGTSINGQGGWTVEDSFGNAAELFDESIVDDGGNKVWQISNSVTGSSFSNRPFSPSAPLIAGETGAGLYNDYGPDHTMPFSPPQSSGTAGTSAFRASWDFKSATDAAQAGLQIGISAGASQSPLRQTLLTIADTGAGFDLSFTDTEGASFTTRTIATGLSYTDWHTVEMAIDFVDGIGAGDVGNDVVSIFVNGSLAFTGTTWESYYYTTTDGLPAPSVRAVDSLMFRTAGTAAPDTEGNGFYFDNVSVGNAASPVPEPGSFVLAGMAFTAVAALRRRWTTKVAVEG